MKYYRNVLSQLKVMLQLQWAEPLTFLVMWQWSLTFSSSLLMSFSQIQQVLLDWIILLLFHLWSSQIFVKMFIHFFFTILINFKNCFNKFINSIFTSKKNYLLDKFIITTKKFVSKTTRNVILIFFWERTFTTFNTL